MVWQGIEEHGYGIQGRLFASDGLPIGSTFLVSTYSGTMRSPSVAVDSSGSFVVVWSSSEPNNGDSSFRSIQGRRFLSDGSSLGAKFLVNEYTTNSQTLPSIAMSSSGGLHRRVDEPSVQQRRQ